MNNPIQNLLSKVRSIKERYETIENHTGDNFNVFKIMGMEYDEVYTHSAILGELLSMKGSHNLKSTFLKLILDEVKSLLSLNPNPDLLTVIERLKIDNYEVHTEYSIGAINKDKTEGGRIDILIESNNAIMIIENKINAIDQENQLLRYYNYGSKTGKPFLILYLSRFQQTPEEFENKVGKSDSFLKALEEVQKKTLCVTYEKTIKEWLEKCMPLTIEKPFLRETLQQYFKTVKKITNQSTDIEMEQEIVSQIVQNADSLKSALEISKNINKAKLSLFNGMKIKLIEWAIKENYVVQDGDDDPNQKWGCGILQESHINFKAPDLDLPVVIALTFGRKTYSDFEIGVYLNQNHTNFYNLKQAICNCIVPIAGIESDENWNNWAYIYRFKNEWVDWDNNQEMWLKIQSGVALSQLKEWITDIAEALRTINAEDFI